MYPPPEVITAKKDIMVTVLGETPQPLKLMVRGMDKVYPFQPAIVRGLHTAINLSGPWLKTQGWDDLHSQGCMSIEGQHIPLVDHNTAEPSVSGIFALKDLTIEARTGRNITALIPDIRGKQVSPGLGCFETGGKLHRVGIHTGPAVLTQVQGDGTTQLPVINMTDRDVVIKAGTNLGTITSSEEDLKYVTSMVQKDPGPTTWKKKKEEYIQNFVRWAKAKAGKGKKIKTTKLTLEQKKQWILETFYLARKPCLAKEEDLKRATELLLKFWDLFSHDGSYGHTHLIQHRIITEDVPPIKCRYRPINPALEPALREQLDEWLKHDVIEPADSPWSSNLVAAKKKGGKIRWCIDWRRLNEVTKKDSWPMPTVQDTIARLAGSNIFSGVDMAGAFHCIDIHPDDREKTAFATPFGTFQQKRLGFGVTNGPATYCRLVDKVLQKIPPTEALSFVDDGVVHSDGLDQHLRNLEKTLQAYLEAGLKLGPHKCSFFSPQITYLGHTVDKHGIKPVSSYVEAVRDWPLPQYKTEARAFLGITVYYRPHIKDYAKIARPWTDVIGKTAEPGSEKQKLVVTEAMAKAFETLKRALTTAPILGFPYFKGPMAGQFILDTDFCQTQIAGILSQMQDGKETVIAYGSKKLNKSQRNYPSTKGELYAGITWMDKFRYYLQHGPKFKWRTDNAALKWIKTMEPKGAILERWLTMLSKYDFEVKHHAGTKHGNADALSRGGKAEEADPEDSDDTLAIQAMCVIMPPNLREKLREAQETDETLSKVRQWVIERQVPTTLERRRLSVEAATYAGFIPELLMTSEGLLRRNLLAETIHQAVSVPCVPESMKEEIIKLAHMRGGHMGIHATIDRLRRRFYFPKLRAEVEDFVKGCKTCQQKLRANQPQKHTLVSPTCGYPFQRLHIDLVGPLNPSQISGAKWILTCRDASPNGPRPTRLRIPLVRPSSGH